MEAFIASVLLVFVSEMGDKTQLLSLVLVARYKQPWIILLGVLLATLANHALAAGAGGFVAGFVSPQVLKWLLAATFIGFAAWILIPDSEGELKSSSQYGVLITTFVSFFIAEMGDKTQLATVALGAHYSSVFFVTAGSSLGMLGSNALAVFLGDKMLQRIPMKYVRLGASLLFLLFGIGVIFGF